MGSSAPTKQTPSPLRKRVWIALLLMAIGIALAFWQWRLQQFEARGAAPSAAHVAERLRCEIPAVKPMDSSLNQPAGMVWVPTGSFVMGDSIYPEEQPLLKMRVKGFWMDQTEVTNEAFAAFVNATGYVTVAERVVDPKLHPELPPEMRKPGAVVFTSPLDLQRGGDPRQWWQYVPGAQWRHPQGPGSTIEGKGSFPVVAVTLEDAGAYARWLHRDLPTEAEWEWAARSAQDVPPTEAPRRQPEQANTWQGMFPVSNQAADGFRGVAPVGCFAANALGLHDMIGNVWELTATRYREQHSAADNVPPDNAPPAARPGASAMQVIKGGSFLCAPNYCMRYRAAARQPQETDLATSHVGFRTIHRAPGP